MSRRVLVVGAGFAGAIHARELADRGFEVDVIDQRSHIAEMPSMRCPKLAFECTGTDLIFFTPTLRTLLPG